MDSSAGSDSSGGRRPMKAKELKCTVTPLAVMRPQEDNLDKPSGVCSTDLCIAQLNLNKPSGVIKDWQRPVCLYLVDPNDNFSLRILREIHHKNILHLESAINALPSDKICVERYTESLCYTVFKCNHLSVAQDLVRQVVEGLEELRINGLYHGNLSIHTTYYDANTKLVKLANFKEKGDDKGLIEAQIGDWHDLGSLLREFSGIMCFTDKYMLENLACQLKFMSPEKPPGQVKDQTLNHVYFWGRNRRSSFFTYGIIGALHSPDFKAKVQNLEFIDVDWHKVTDRLLWADMNAYRRKRGGKEYKGKGRHQYVVYVSGAYSHEDELSGYYNLDKVISQESPRLLLELVEIVRELGYDV